ncbi:translocase [Sulfitobacter sp.]|jgi:preprotein translocase subunit SecA|uniref:preprotein translocase subunit SecA n=1 Tax=Sulfitobacter sp. TaxID=1903071 RepID=UPI003EF38C88
MSDQAMFPQGHGLHLPEVIAYDERPDVKDEALDRISRKLLGAVISRGSAGRSRRLKPILRAVRRHADAFEALDDAGLKAHAQSLRAQLRQALLSGTPKVALLGQSFALVREVAHRTLGMRHYDVQIMGAYAMMQGQIAEMRTGEGKTLCATLAVATMALGGVPVHVITVNDYLAERDAELMQPVYAFLGLDVGVILEGQSEAERQQIYKRAVVHGANKEIAFDYLRDRMVLRRQPGNLHRKVERITGKQIGGALRMNGLHFALIDEADSVLVDEARTPLVISGAVSQGQGHDIEMFQSAMVAAEQLQEGPDYKVLASERRVVVSKRGLEKLDEMAADSDGAFGVPVIREQAVVQALTAVHLFHRDVDYIIKDDAVQIVDENTGRVQEDRSWSEGLHQMIELKEGLELSDLRETLSRITYQRFFRRYGKVAGMTGTARDAAWELYSVYGLKVARIPTNKPDIRRFARDRVLKTEEAKWDAIAARTHALIQTGVPVLIGTRSVAASEAASAALAQRGVMHDVLNARQDADEAALITRAGQAGAVTVATNMAGRGTDIKLGAGMADLGGLHVILSERHDSRRVDRQLEGRCGRQGDPGQVEVFLSLGDELMRSNSARFSRRMARFIRPMNSRLAGSFFRLRQRKIEKLHARMRLDLLEADRSLGNLLAVSGQLE